MTAMRTTRGRPPTSPTRRLPCTTPEPDDGPGLMCSRLGRPVVGTPVRLHLGLRTSHVGRDAMMLFHDAQMLSHSRGSPGIAGAVRDWTVDATVTSAVDITERRGNDVVQEHCGQRALMLTCGYGRTYRCGAR
jgi:hypothetical protein